MNRFYHWLSSVASKGNYIDFCQTFRIVFVMFIVAFSITVLFLLHGDRDYFFSLALYPVVCYVYLSKKQPASALFWLPILGFIVGAMLNAAGFVVSLSRNHLGIAWVTLFSIYMGLLLISSVAILFKIHRRDLIRTFGVTNIYVVSILVVGFLLYLVLSSNVVWLLFIAFILPLLNFRSLSLIALPVYLLFGVSIISVGEKDWGVAIFSFGIVVFSFIAPVAYRKSKLKWG